MKAKNLSSEREEERGGRGQLMLYVNFKLSIRRTFFFEREIAFKQILKNNQNGTMLMAHQRDRQMSEARK